MYVSRGLGGLPHGDGDLIESADDVADCVESVDARHLIGIDFHFLLIGQFRADFVRDVRRGNAAEEWINGVEGEGFAVLIAPKASLPVIAEFATVTMDVHAGLAGFRNLGIINAVCIGWNEVDVRAVCAQKKTMARSVLELPIDADAQVTRFVRVANRTKAYGVACDGRFNPLPFRQPIFHAGREDDTGGGVGAMFGYDVKAVARFFEAFNRAFDDRCVEGFGLPCHACEKFVTGNALREAWAIVAFGDPFRAAVAVVQNEDVAMKAAQVGGCGEASGSGADDDDFVVFFHDCQHRATGVIGM